MCKDITLNMENQVFFLFLPVPIKAKKAKVDFDASDLPSNGGLALIDKSSCAFFDEIVDCIPYYCNQSLILYSPICFVNASVRFFVAMGM